MPNKPVQLRMPDRTRALLDAIRAQTGMTITQVVIQAIECLAAKLKVTI